MVRTKVFVGNLDFRTKETDLATFFADAGKVISANIITRGPRSLGYGFVEMDSEEDATNAVKLMNKKDLDGRPINVELAKPRDETAVAETNNQQNEARGGFRGGRGGRGGFRGTRGSRGGFRGTRGTYRRRGSFRGTRGAPVATRGTGERRRSASNRSNEPDTRTPSKTTLFIANLPFKMDDEAFGKVFKDNSLAFKSAHVVVNQRSGRSKGFGFAEFENEADQLKSLNAINKKEVDGRELVVKVALTENKPPVTENKEASATPAPTKQ